MGHAFNFLTIMMLFTPETRQRDTNLSNAILSVALNPFNRLLSLIDVSSRALPIREFFVAVSTAHLLLGARVLGKRLMDVIYSETCNKTDVNNAGATAVIGAAFIVDMLRKRIIRDVSKTSTSAFEEKKTCGCGDGWDCGHSTKFW